MTFCCSAVYRTDISNNPILSVAFLPFAFFRPSLGSHNSLHVVSIRPSVIHVLCDKTKEHNVASFLILIEVGGSRILPSKIYA